MPSPRETPNWDLSAFANSERTEFVWRGADSHADTVLGMNVAPLASHGPTVFGFDPAAPGADRAVTTQVAAAQADQRYGVTTINWRELHSTYNVPTPDPNEPSGTVRQVQAVIDQAERQLRDMINGSLGTFTFGRETARPSVTRARGRQIYHDTEPEDL